MRWNGTIDWQSTGHPAGTVAAVSVAVAAAAESGETATATTARSYLDSRRHTDLSSGWLSSAVTVVAVSSLSWCPVLLRCERASCFCPRLRCETKGLVGKIVSSLLRLGIFWSLCLLFVVVVADAPLLPSFLPSRALRGLSLF